MQRKKLNESNSTAASSSDPTLLLPNDIVSEISYELDCPALHNVLFVSKNWNSLFKDSLDWINKIERDFKITRKCLSLFSAEFKEDKIKFSQFYKKIYERLWRLTTQNNYSTYLNFKKILKDRYKHVLLIACLTDDFEYLSQVILKDEYISCFEIAVYARCNQVAKYIVNQDRENLIKFLGHAIQSGNIEIAKFIIDFKDLPSTELTKINNFLEKQAESLSAKSGSLKMLTHFFDLSHYASNQEILYSAAESGNENLVLSLLDEKNKLNLKLDEQTFIHAINSGSIKLVAELLKLRDELKDKLLLTDEKIIPALVKSGNRMLIPYFFKQELIFNLENVLDAISNSCTLDFFTFLVENQREEYEEINLKYYAITFLNSAFKVGNIPIISFLLDPQKEFEIELDEDHLLKRIRHVESFTYLLDPRNEFTFKVIKNDEAIKTAFFGYTQNEFSCILNFMINYRITKKRSELIINYPSYLIPLLEKAKQKLRITMRHLSDTEFENICLECDVENVMREEMMRGYLEQSNIDKLLQNSLSPHDTLLKIFNELNCIQKLVLCEIAIQTALDLLQSEECKEEYTGKFNMDLDKTYLLETHADIDASLYVAYEYSPSHLYASIEHMLMKPDFYKLSNAAIELIKTFMNKLIHTQTPLLQQRFAYQFPELHEMLNMRNENESKNMNEDKNENKNNCENMNGKEKDNMNEMQNYRLSL